MAKKPYNVLFLCTGNSARSIFGEAILNRTAGGRFRAYSAGSHPRGQVHPFALQLLSNLGHPTEGLRSKSWDEFEGDGAPKMDLIFTVCHAAANETCPVWPGQPVTTHWSIPDPAAAMGTEAEVRLAFAEAYRTLAKRIELLTSLPLDALVTASLRQHLADINTAPSGAKPLPD